MKEKMHWKGNSANLKTKEREGNLKSVQVDRNAFEERKIAENERKMSCKLERDR
jgi:hypothetical protein